MTKFLRIYFLTFGLIDLIATGTAFILSFNVLTLYFSYFTVLSNILIITVFLYLGFINPKKISKTLLAIYGAAVLYMTITGVIYWSILVNQHSLSLDPWINLTMHGVMPISAFLSWILFSPKRKLEYKTCLIWQIFPLLFVAYTLIHGPFINWYPYPFLNPLMGGYGKVTLDVLLILGGSWILGLLLIWIANLKFRK